MLVRVRPLLLWLLIAAFLFAGAAHLRSPDAFLRITPAWVPLAREVILVTGLCEIAGAIGLMTNRFRRIAGILLAAYAVCVFPANIQHALDDLGAGTGLGWWYHAPRLLFQPVIVWWCLFAGEVTDWPSHRHSRESGNPASSS